MASEPLALQVRIERALRAKQRELGIEEGGSNLWPGTAAFIASTVVMDCLQEMMDGRRVWSSQERERRHG